MKLIGQKITIRVALGTLFVLVTMLTIATAIGLQYYFSKQSGLNNTLERYQSISNNINKQLSELDRAAIAVVEKAALSFHIFEQPFSNQQDLIELFTTVLKHDQNIYSIYVADQDENLFQVISLHSQDTLLKIAGRNNESWLVVEHHGVGSERRKTLRYLDSSLNLTRQVVEASSLLPTQRPWYQDARHHDVHKTKPYLFSHLNITGQSYSKKIEGTERVLAIDYTLTTIESYLSEGERTEQIHQDFEAYLFLDDGKLIATNQDVKIDEDLPIVSALSLTPEQTELINKTPPLKVSSQLDWAPIDFAISGQPYGVAIDILNLISVATGLEFEYVNGLSWSELVSDYQQGRIDVLHSVATGGDINVTYAKQLELYNIPYGLVTKTDNKQLTQSIQSFSGRIGLLEGWTIQDKLESTFPNAQFVTYPSIDDALVDINKGVLNAVLDNSMVLQNKLSSLALSNLSVTEISDQLINGSYSMLLKDKHRALFPIISFALSELNTEDNRQYLIDKWTKDRPIYTHVPYERVLNLSKQASDVGTLQEFMLNGANHYLFLEQLTTPEKQILAIIIPESEIMESVHQQIERFLIASIIILSCLLPTVWFLAVPVVRPIKEIERQARLISQRQYHKINLIPSRVTEIHKLSLQMLDMSKSLQSYEKEQELFIDSFIKLVADAIDEKSPYTGGHCMRVPELAMMLIEELHGSEKEPFNNFQFNNAAERREFKVAAWLHDCGKITTPEYVVDKATKLETIYNRIHEIRTRFEVIWRDAQIDALQNQIKGIETAEESKAKLESKFAQLTEQFEFIANSNIGGEFMSDDKLEQIQAIAEQKWTRNFDDSLGLSASELGRRKSNEADSRQESLIDDKAWHIIEREREYHLDPELAIKMDVPKHLYNQGELYNLSIRKGTLTDEERFKINEHMISGIKMLNNIPFPTELGRVPQYATTHHETLKGTGYPRKLSAEELTMPERVLAISDIFEALTASDRPYKPAKTISESLDILQFMVNDNHLDADVFKLFVENEIYLKYAQRFLDSNQIDKVNKDKYLA